MVMQENVEEDDDDNDDDDDYDDVWGSSCKF